MPRKTKDHIPKNMDDLEKIFYGDKKDGRNVNLYRQRRYLDHLRAQVMSPRNEADFKNMFAHFGKIEKIPEDKNHPTFDYKLDSHKLLFEVTSLNTDEVYPTKLAKEDVLRKLDVAIDHILAKDSSGFPNYRKGGVIVYDLIFILFSEFDKMLDGKLPEISGMLDNDLDFLVFLPVAAALLPENKDSWDVYPIVFYIKDKSLASEFKIAFQNKNYKIFLGSSII